MGGLMRYPGGKNSDGVYHKIINLMPPHQVYIEPFLGSGAILRRKSPAHVNIGVDKLSLLKDWKENENTKIIQGCGLEFLENYPFKGNELVYCDPPYLPETRTNRPLYKNDMSETSHKRLLEVIRKLPCMVMVSGYESKLYLTNLKDWSHNTFKARTSGGRTVIEWLWFNFPEPTELHDYRFLGANLQERQRIKRKKERWIKRLKGLPTLEKHAILAAIQESNTSCHSQK